MTNSKNWPKIEVKDGKTTMFTSESAFLEWDRELSKKEIRALKKDPYALWRNPKPDKRPDLSGYVFVGIAIFGFIWAIIEVYACNAR